MVTRLAACREDKVVGDHITAPKAIVGVDSGARAIEEDVACVAIACTRMHMQVAFSRMHMYMCIQPHAYVHVHSPAAHGTPILQATHAPCTHTMHVHVGHVGHCGLPVMYDSAVFAWTKKDDCFSYSPTSRAKQPITVVYRGCSPSVPMYVCTT